VAGFNQLFDDIDGTVAWRYGAGVDHKFSNQLASGLEYSERQLYIPGFNHGVDRSEQMARAYVNFTPHDRVSLGTEYFYENIDQSGRVILSSNALNGGLFDTVQTHRVPVTLGLFHPSGLALKIKPSFIHQEGIFQNQNSVSRTSGVSNFFIVDLNLSYRLPQRHGMFSLGVNNVFDDRINYQNTNNNETLLAPSRLLFSRINLAF
jgi:outer membrane receptor for ferrienterochelin and colicin